MCWYRNMHFEVFTYTASTKKSSRSSDRELLLLYNCSCVRNENRIDAVDTNSWLLHDTKYQVPDTISCAAKVKTNRCLKRVNYFIPAPLSPLTAKNIYFEVILIPGRLPEAFNERTLKDTIAVAKTSDS